MAQFGSGLISRPAGARRVRRFVELLRRPTVLAVVDQAAVSGASFFTTVLVGRFADAQQLGLYSLGISIVLALLAVQMSLLTTPYAVHHHRDDVCSKTYAGSTLLMHIMLLAAAIVGLTAASFVAGPSLRIVLWTLVAAGPVLMVREFGRRMGYARLSVGTALAVDLPVVVVQIAVLAMLAKTGLLTAPSALLALCFAGAIGGIIGIVSLRRRMVFDRAAIGPDARRSWRFGRWIAGAQLLEVVNTQGVFWLVAVLVSTEATGVYAACLAVVLLCNPFMLAVGNVLTPRAAQTLSRHGYPGLRQLVGRASLVLAGVMTLFCVALCICGDRIVQLIYGSQYAGYGAVIALLGASFLVGAVQMAVNDGLRALGRADLEFRAALLDTVVTIAAGAVGLKMFGLVGLAGASLVGGLVALAVQASGFRRLSREAA